MQRVTITLDDDLMAALDTIIAARGYQSRSEAIRDLARAAMIEAAENIHEKSQDDCVAALVYVYDHAARELSKRLTKAFHDHHEMSLASLHVHLDHDTCLEVTVLRGSANQVQHFGAHVIAERGVRYGRVVHMPVGETGGRDHGRKLAGEHRHEHGDRATVASRRTRPRGASRRRP